MKKLTTIRIDETVHSRVMRMIYWTPGLKLNSLVERLLDITVSDLETQRGELFPEIPDENELLKDMR